MQDDNDIIKIKSDNPDWQWEIYDKTTGIFLCYYISTSESKKLKKNRKLTVVPINNFPL
jgi:hypothetical protein